MDARVRTSRSKSKSSNTSPYPEHSVDVGVRGLLGRLGNACLALLLAAALGRPRLAVAPLLLLLSVLVSFPLLPLSLSFALVR